MADHAKSVTAMAGRLLDQGFDVAGGSGNPDGCGSWRRETHGDLQTTPSCITKLTRCMTVIAEHASAANKSSLFISLCS